jgi:hypothetical protein
MQERVGVDGLMRAVERPESEMDDADRDGADVVVGSGNGTRQCGEAAEPKSVHRVTGYRKTCGNHIGNPSR